MSIDEVLREARRLYEEYLEAVAVEAPQMRSARTKSFRFGEATLRSWAIRSLIRILDWVPSGRPRKYVFQGLRHRHLIQTLPASEVMVLGGRGEFFACLRMGYRFRWIGFVAKAFELFFWKGDDAPLRAAVATIRRRMAPPEERPGYLFLYEDTLPTGLVLALALSSVPGLAITCVQHGYFGPERLSRRNEGTICRFNLLIDQEQGRFIKGLSDPESFVLGLPYEVAAPPRIVRKVVLVGAGGRGSDAARYLLSLSHFIRIYHQLREAGIAVSYRPHPDEDRDFVSSLFSHICLKDKWTLFHESRAIYAGFISTLLFEALSFGNGVIGLDTSEFAGDRAFEPDRIVAPSDYVRIAECVNELFEIVRERTLPPIPSVADRFRRCIEQIDAALAAEARGEPGSRRNLA